MQLPIPAPVPPVSGTGRAFADSWSAWIDFGSLPDLLAALAGTGALVAAIFAVRYAKRSFEQQAKQIAALEREKRAEQASKVVAYLERVPLNEVDEGNPQRRLAWSLHVLNRSDLPIYMVDAWIEQPGGLSGEMQFRPVLPPGDHVLLPYVSTSGLALASMAFNDTAESSWLRGTRGSLIEFPDMGYLRALTELIPFEGFKDVNINKLSVRIQVREALDAKRMSEQTADPTPADPSPSD
ncbi:hypothetical protein [Pseudonocardia sp. WMMC193]|uniref:hypothetical protein n=1 Tax=Pseudonocardia sp. WMMC193 TaxID=2911965 RepID=UPI001F30F6FE|nr:hypothetical protein [Pseudonocardia sp. WMMC193]MCF7548161.1 hypothetical protein [Pseudonocardia sp. WMMC193]